MIRVVSEERQSNARESTMREKTSLGRCSGEHVTERGHLSWVLTEE